MLKKFNKIYGFHESTPFKRVELEDAIIEKFGDLHYNKYEDIIKTEENSARYFVGCKNNWGIYELSSTPQGKSAEEALMLFFINYGVEQEEGTEESYVDNFVDEIHKLVHKAYGC